MSAETNNENHKGKDSVRQWWIEALIVGSSIGLIVLLLQMFFQYTGFTQKTLIIVAAGLVVYLIQIAVSSLFRRR